MAHNWLNQQNELLTRGFERVRDEVIDAFEKEMKRREESLQLGLKKKDDNQQILLGRYNEEMVKNSSLIEENSLLKHQLQKRGQKEPIPAANAAKPIDNAANPIDAPLIDATSADGATVPREEYHHLAEKFKELEKEHKAVAQRLKYVEKKNVAVMQKNKEMKERVVAWQKFSERQKTKGQKMEPQTKPTFKIFGRSEHVDDGVPLELFSSPGSALLMTPVSLVAPKSSPPPGFHLPSNAYPSTSNEEARAVSREQSHGAVMHMAGTVSNIEGDESQHLLHQCPELPGDIVENMEIQIPHADEGTTPLHHWDAVTMLTHPDERTTLNHANQASALPGRLANHNDTLGSSQTTEVETQIDKMMMPPPTKMEDDDDVPQFVSERFLKRKRPGPAKVSSELPSDGTPIRPFRVKDESCSSPLRQISTSKLARDESIDLDDLGPMIITTPHHRRTVNRYLVVGPLRHQRSTSVPLVQEEMVNMEDHRENNGSPVHGTSEARAYSAPSEEIRDGLNVLRTLDSNTRVAELSREQSPRKKAKKGESRHAMDFDLLSESGEEPPPRDANPERPTADAVRFKYYNRMSKEKDRIAKNLQTPVKKAAKTPATAPSKSNTDQFRTPGCGASSRPAPRTLAHSEPRSKVHKAKSEPEPEGPLRDKPVSQLRLTDFKANPKYNQGYSYAFQETVRKRSDRACLMGCTREECCGSTFRILAAIAPPLTSVQESNLLKEYLGDAYDSTKLKMMTREERKDLVLQARTREMANTHGKHRQAYERHTTPPGYWRTDFPTTQEQNEDAEKARRMEKEMVKDRWAEVMRPGGRWMFRDE